ncbi:hypothetical protein DFH07DRAFT_702051, partial [Mycena maculata]
SSPTDSLRPASPPPGSDTSGGAISLGHNGQQDVAFESDDDVPACAADAPFWFSKVYPEVSQHNLGSGFNALLRVFIDVERSYGWVKGGKGLATLNRPPQLSAWITAGRGSRGGGGVMANGIGPAIPSVVVFDMRWWQWWGSLQPPWRLSDSRRPRERYLRDMYPASPGAQGGQSLRHPGPNGALSLIATLYWWGVKLGKEGGQEERESWVEAVTDVKWMLRGLL